jgi:hypothetical protein
MKEIDEIKNLKLTFMKLSARFDHPNELGLKLLTDLKNDEDILKYHEKIKSQLESKVQELFEMAADLQRESDISKDF